jgi:serine/threonine-protein kinase
MGLVFKARDRFLEETVALKVLAAGSSDPDMARRFRSEVKLAWKVRHPNVCSIHEYGEDGPLLYLSMELVEGTDLKQILQECSGLSWEEACGIALQVAEGLAAIHEAGVVHRDLKPANIMRDAAGRVRLLDFGIAKVMDAPLEEGITTIGQVVGSPEYMSPEQVRGAPVDVRSDLYALGVVLFEMLTGRVPFRGETPVATMIKHLEEPAPVGGAELARIPPVLVPVLQRALAKDPAARFASCREMLGALHEARVALARRSTDGVEAPVASGAARPDLSEQPTAALAAAERAYPPEASLLVPMLLRALGHRDPEVRAAAAEALGRGRHLEASGALARTLETDEAALVRQRAGEALRRLGID